jgi:hypothetical protein
VDEVGEHEKDDDGTQLVGAIGQHHQGDTDIAGIAEHAGYDQSPPLQPPKAKQAEQQPR